MKLCPNCNNSSINIVKKCPTCGNALDEVEAVSFGTVFKAQVKNAQLSQQAAQQEEKERIAQMDREGIAYCPKCHSTSLSANKKGFGVGKAIIGASITAPLGGGILGAAAGNIGAKKVRITCLKCGHQFWPGKK